MLALNKQRLTNTLDSHNQVEVMYRVYNGVGLSITSEARQKPEVALSCLLKVLGPEASKLFMHRLILLSGTGIMADKVREVVMAYNNHLPRGSPRVFSYWVDAARAGNTAINQSWVDFGGYQMDMYTQDSNKVLVRLLVGSSKPCKKWLPFSNTSSGITVG